jgi:hypothetical protein
MTLHKQRRTPTRSLIAVGALALVVLIPTVTASAEPDGVSSARAGTATYHNIDTSAANGYGLFKDKNGIACIDNPGVGGMGIHYVNGTLVGDASVNAATPEALVYEPQANGQLNLVAVEYIVFQSAWDAGNANPPSLFGQTFELVLSPNRYGIPAFYELHAWIWKHNPSGMFNDWNPLVSCAAA